MWPSHTLECKVFSSMEVKTAKLWSCNVFNSMNFHTVDGLTVVKCKAVDSVESSIVSILLLD